MYSTLKRRGNERFQVVSTWNTRGVFVGKGSVFIKLQVSKLKNEFLDNYFSRIFHKTKLNKIKLNYTNEASNT